MAKQRDIITNLTEYSSFFKQNNPMPLYKKISFLDRYYNWRISIYERDRLMCQNCKEQCRRKTVFESKDKYLPIAYAHRPFPLKDLIKKFNIRHYYQPLFYKEFWNIDDGITLCVRCFNKK